MTPPRNPDQYHDLTDPKRRRRWEELAQNGQLERGGVSRSRATTVAVLGTLSLLPGWGLILGSIGWVMGNKELREIASGARDGARERRARIGRILSIIGFTLSVAFVVAVGLFPGFADTIRDLAEEPSWFEANDVTFVYPDDWEVREVATPSIVDYHHVVAPERSGGNLMSFTWFGPNSAEQMFGPPEGRIERLAADAVDIAPGVATGEPERVQISGFDSVVFDVAGVTGNRTGQPLAARVAVVAAEEDVYMLLVQFEDGSERMMLDSWDRMLADFRAP